MQTPEIPVDGTNHSKHVCPKLFCSLKNCFVEYCSVSSIAGFVHLNSHELLHRVFWFILLVASVIGCYFTNVRLLGAREVLILNEDNTMSTSEIPFPAVTVCTTVKVDHRKFNYYEVARKWLFDITEEELMNYQLLRRILYETVESGRQGSSVYVGPKPKALDNIEGRIYELGIKEEDLITSCSINNKSCLWSKVLTPDGLCYAFNLIDPDELFQQNIHKQYLVKGIRTKGWSYKHGYESNFETNVYPLRGLAANKNNELKMRLKLNLNDLVNSHANIDGFAIYVGHPIDYPFHVENRVFVPLNVQYVLNISPEMILADEGLTNYPLKDRKCFIQKKEWDHLKLFKEYSINNCQLECIAELSKKQCDCVEYFIPRSEGKTCGLEYSDRKYCYHYAIYDQLLRDTLFMQTMNFSSLKCNCIPHCASLTYTIHETLIEIVPTTNETYSFSDVTVRFNSAEFLPKRRQESYSNLDILSAFGGNLGLFVAASVMNIIEFIFYFSIRICFEFFLYDKNYI